MMKLNSLVLLVLCGATVSHGVISLVSLPDLGNCPPLLNDLVVKCGVSVDLSFPTRLDCESSLLQCLAETLLDALGLDSTNTQFNSTVLVDSLVDVDVRVATVNTCLAEVGGLNIGGGDCQLAAVGGLGLCLLQKLDCLL